MEVLLGKVLEFCPFKVRSAGELGWVQLGWRCVKRTPCLGLVESQQTSIATWFNVKVEVWVPVMKREDWLKLSSTEKILHRTTRTIDRIEQAQARYERGRASGKISERIPFFEPSPPDSTAEL